MKYETKLTGSKKMSIVERYIEIKEKYGDKPYVELLSLTVQDAIYLLENMHRNRRVKQKNLTIIKTKMNEKGWIYGSGSIKISRDGQLLDGQHRLEILKALKIDADNVTVQWNVDPETMHDIDTGAIRSESDVFKILGYSFAKDIPAIIKSIFWGNKLNMTKKTLSLALLNKKDFNLNKADVTMSTKQMEDFYNIHRNEIDIVLSIFYEHKRSKVSFPVKTFGTFVRALKGNYCSSEEIDLFFRLFYSSELTGFTPSTNQPPILKQILNASSDRHGTSSMLTKYKQVQKSFKYFLDEKPMNQSLLSSSNLTTHYELFPAPEFDFKD